MKLICNMFLLFKTSNESQQWPQYLAVLSACFLAIGSGFHSGWAGPSVPKLLSNDLGFEVSDEEASYLVMAHPLGIAAGSPLAGFLLNRVGRKCTVIFTVIPQITTYVMMAASTNFVTLCMARFISGIADGCLFTSLPIYMGEVTEPKVRGSLGTTHSLGIILGTLLIFIFGSYVSIRTAAYICLSAPISFLLTFVWMPESPYYLILKNRMEDARNSLQRLRMMTDVEKELFQMKSDVEKQISEPSTLKDLFMIKSNLRGFITLIGLRTFQQLSGLIVLTYYIQIVFEQASASVSPAKSSIICIGIQLIVCPISSRFLDKLGRKPIFMTSSILSAILLIALGSYFTFLQNEYDLSSLKWLPIVTMFLYNVVASIGFLMIPNLMAGELLPVSVKSKGLGLLHMYMGLSMGALSKLFHWLSSTFGMNVPFFMFGACCIGSFVFCHFCVIETKGKTLEEIQQALKCK